MFCTNGALAKQAFVEQGFACLGLESNGWTLFRTLNSRALAWLHHLAGSSECRPWMIGLQLFVAVITSNLLEKDLEITSNSILLVSLHVRLHAGAIRTRNDETYAIALIFAVSVGHAVSGSSAVGSHAVGPQR